VSVSRVTTTQEKPTLYLLCGYTRKLQAPCTVTTSSARSDMLFWREKSLQTTASSLSWGYNPRKEQREKKAPAFLMLQDIYRQEPEQQQSI
jgi:hypothetical protein